MNPIIELVGVTRRYGPEPAVAEASLALFEGRTACLLGPSGCGKSTLLRMIAGLEPVDAGEIRIAGARVSDPYRIVPPEDRGVGLVFQDNALFPHLDVRGNVGFGLAHLPARERAERVDALLEQFHIAQLARSWPHMLSGGEQQRVAIARAMARQPALILLDEPFSGLDGMLRESVRGALLDDLRASRATVLVVSHDPDEAMSIADDLVLMADGRILQCGRPADCYRQPANPTAARLLGDLILLPGSIHAGAIETPLGRFPAPGLGNGAGLIGLRPDGLALGRAGNASEGAARVIEVRPFRSGHRVVLDLAGQRVALVTEGPPPGPGDLVQINCPADAVLIFPSAG